MTTRRLPADLDAPAARYNIPHELEELSGIIFYDSTTRWVNGEQTGRVMCLRLATAAGASGQGFAFTSVLLQLTTMAPAAN